MRLFAYNVRKSLTAAPAIKRLTLVSPAILVTMYHHQLLAALRAQQFHHSVPCAAIP
jgi:4-hydroxy-L-threonine phosphate dehydrogenase PdxA